MPLDLKVISVGVYRHAQRDVQTNTTFYMGYTHAGLRAKSVVGGPVVTHGPILTLTPPGTTTAFEYGPDRENWVALLAWAGCRIGSQPGRVALDCDGHWVEVDWCVPVQPMQAEGWRHWFMDLRDLCASPTPSNRLLASLRAMRVVEQFLAPTPSLAASPAQRLKALIDHDPAVTRTIDTLSRQCGYSPDHLRALFEQTYGLTPVAYRQRRRMAMAMQEVVRGGRSVKQIASLLGFSQVAHLSAAFRQAHGMTPTQAMARFGQR